MKFLLFALASLSIVASAVPKSRTAPACPAADARLPFPLPSPELSSDWGDMEYAQWEASAWSAYCAGRATAFECKCAKARGAY